MSETLAIDWKFLASEEALAAALARLEAEDAVALPVLDDDTCALLLAADQQLTYRVARPIIGEGEKQVRQDFTLCADIPADSLFWSFAAALEELLNRVLGRLDPPPLPQARLNDLIVQRYPVGSGGITPHRDHIRYQGLVALVTLAGRGRFYVCDDRAGSGAREVPDRAGNLSLMRAPGFAGRRDRPFHFLQDISEPRVSLGLRHDVRPGEPI